MPRPNCRRCGGYTYGVWAYHEGESCTMLKCLSCGSYVDEEILKNQMASKPKERRNHVVRHSFPDDRAAV